MRLKKLVAAVRKAMAEYEPAEFTKTYTITINVHKVLAYTWAAILMVIFAVWLMTTLTEPEVEPYEGYVIDATGCKAGNRHNADSVIDKCQSLPFNELNTPPVK